MPHEDRRDISLWGACRRRGTAVISNCPDVRNDDVDITGLVVMDCWFSSRNYRQGQQNSGGLEVFVDEIKAGTEEYPEPVRYTWQKQQEWVCGTSRLATCSAQCRYRQTSNSPAAGAVSTGGVAALERIPHSKRANHS